MDYLCEKYGGYAPFCLQKVVTYSNADFYTSTKLLSFSDNSKCKYSGTSFYFSHMQWFHTNNIHFFLVPMKSHIKSIQLYQMQSPTQCHFTTLHAQNCWS